jgi:tape measure domain-containing protein
VTVESKIIFRSDASEVARDVKVLKGARAELERLRAGTSADPKIALENTKGQNKIAAIRAAMEAKSDAASKKAAIDLGLFKEKRAVVSAEKSAKSEAALEKAKAKAKERADSDLAKASAKVRVNLQKENERIAKKDAKAMTDRLKFETPDREKGLGLSITDMKSALDLALSVGKVVYSAGAAIVQAQAFKEDVSRGFAIIAKSKAEGDRVLALSNQTADFLGRGRAETAGQFLDLLTKGFKPEKVDEITRRLADLSVVDPRANLEGLSRAIGQIAGKGRLQGQELLQLAEAGLETGDVYKALAKNLKKDIPEIIKLQSQGKISSDVGIQAVLDAISAQTGGKGAGEAARAKAREDLSGLIRQISNIPENLLFDIEVGPGLDKLKGTMREVVDFFDASSATGKDVRAVLADVVNSFAEGLFGIDTSKGTVTDTLKALLEVFRSSKGDVKAFASGIASIAGAIAGITGSIGKIAQLRSEFERMSGVDISGPLGIFKGILVGVPSIIVQTISGAIQSITGFSLWDAGANLINSLAGGIKSTAQSVIDAVTSTVGGAISWAKQLLGIASPSKVFMEIGTYSAKGFAGGLAANDNMVQRAAGGMATAGAEGASTAGLGSRSTSRVSSTVVTAVYSPIYTVTAMGPKEVDELKALQADEFARFEEIMVRLAS